MKILLLSGGSGKRLWPLSNDSRSKQFLHLLKSPDGSHESMIQRVVRQIDESSLDSEIIIATNIAQKDSIINQLGDRVTIVTEPERRDTFPAIALASMYISKSLKCSDDEIVVAMPCDAYTDDSYYDVISKMVSAVEANTAELVLMGINPTYPSEKFGYIVPVQNACEKDIKKVSRFTEKPTVERAKELLSDGAMWNGGVFAFRLGYLRSIAEKYIQSDSFDYYVDHYHDFPKISFDYEVAEKAKSVAVIPYSGRWKDLGTWNSLCEELDSKGIGNVMMGEDTANTNVINELGIPVFCNGVKDTVVAASPDGIMVCSKEESEKIKDYVSKLVTRPMFEERRWGSYRVLDSVQYDDGTKSLTKSINILPGKHISYQIHHRRSETWTILNGEGIFVYDGQSKRVSRGDVLHIDVEHYHAIKAITDLTFIEVQIGNPLIEEDIERFDWNWE